MLVYNLIYILNEEKEKEKEKSGRRRKRKRKKRKKEKTKSFYKSNNVLNSHSIYCGLVDTNMSREV